MLNTRALSAGRLNGQKTSKIWNYLLLALIQFNWCKSMQLIETIFDSIFFNGRPLASLVRLTQTISGRLGRILFPLPFGQI